MSERQERNKQTALDFYDRYDHVILHSHQSRGSWSAGMRQLPFDDTGRIVEHWDVLHVIPGTAANENTMF